MLALVRESGSPSVANRRRVAKWHLHVPLPLVFNSIPARLAAALLGTLCLPPLPALAQAANTVATPASTQTMADLILAAAVNSCELAVSEKVPIEKISVSAAKSIAFVVETRHASQIQDAGKVEPIQIFNATLAQTIVSIKNGCYAKLAQADKVFVDKMIDQLQKAVKASSQNQPAKK